MDDLDHSRTPAKVFGATAFSVVGHLFGALTCATCWAIFDPALLLLFGSAGAGVLAALRPYAPLSLLLSALGLAYSCHQLFKKRHESRKLPFRLAAAFTALSAIGWGASTAYVAVTLMSG
jgi:hypothetical protein